MMSPVGNARIQQAHYDYMVQSIYLKPQEKLELESFKRGFAKALESMLAGNGIGMDFEDGGDILPGGAHHT